MFLHADSEDSNQTGQMPRVTRVFAERTSHFAGFVKLWLIYHCKLDLSASFYFHCFYVNSHTECKRCRPSSVAMFCGLLFYQIFSRVSFTRT